MRRLFKAVSPSPSVLISPEAALGRIQASQWLFRLLELPITLDSNFFFCLRWCADALKGLPPMLLEQAAACSGRKRSYARLRAAVTELQELPDKSLEDALEELAEDHAWFQPQMRRCLQSFISSRFSKDT